MAAAKALDKIGSRLDLRLEFDDGARQELSGLKIDDELEDVSSGTALAILLRPAGLVLEPIRPSGGTLHYRIGKPRAGHEAWPAGWKPPLHSRLFIPSAVPYRLEVMLATRPAAKASS